MNRLPGSVLDEYCWPFFARPSQLAPPGAWRVWLILAGRGFGKTRTGTETVRMAARSGEVGRIALVGETAADVRDVMVEGPDGILARSRKEERPKYEPSKRRLTWPNGMAATTYAGEDPEQLRGPQHGFAWVDELAKYRYAQEMWDNLMMGLRIGRQPRCIVTTTPRPITLIRGLLKREASEGNPYGDVAVTRGSTYDNRANLPEAFLWEMEEKYEGTTLGRQELHAELLDEAPGALWRRAMLDGCRLRQAGELVRVVVAVDPSVSETGEGDECGIVAAGLSATSPPVGYVLFDRSLRGSPGEWAAAVVKLYHETRANLVVAEGNQGGALVRQVLRALDGSMPVETVYASRGKAARAEPVAMLYEQGRVHHVGTFPLLEDELVTWTPGAASPNRLDALVWALTALMVQGGGEVSGEVF